MPDPANLSACITSACIAAMPIVEATARRLADRLGLRPQDREDVEQELWLGLLAHWSRAAAYARQSSGVLPSASSCASPGHMTETDLRHRIARDVDQVASSLLRASSLQRHIQAVREYPQTAWIENGLAVQPADDLRLRHLRRDLATVLSRLPDDLHELCWCLLHGESNAALAGCDGADRGDFRHRMMALRRVFRAHSLHEYL